MIKDLKHEKGFGLLHYKKNKILGGHQVFSVLLAQFLQFLTCSQRPNKILSTATNGPQATLWTPLG